MQHTHVPDLNEPVPVLPPARSGRALWLCLLLLAAAVMRLINLGAHELWSDEKLSLLHAVGSFWTAPITAAGATFTSSDVQAGNGLTNLARSAVADDGGNGILFYLLLHGWVSLFGRADALIRLPSVLFGVTTVWLTFRYAREWLGERVAWWAAAGVAISPQLIEQSQDARGYMLATCLGLMATACCVRTVRAQGAGRAWIGYGLAAGGAMLSHYLAVGLLFAHIGYALLCCRNRRAWLQLVGSALIAGTVVLVWLQLGGWEGMANMAAQARRFEWESRNLPISQTAAWPATPQRVFTGVMQMINAVSGNQMENAGFRVRQTIPWLIVPLGLGIAAWRRRLAVDRGLLLLVTLLAVSGAALSTVMALRSGHIVSFLSRFATFSTPYAVMLMAAGVVALADRPWLQRAALAVCVPITLWSVQLVYDDAGGNRLPNRIATLAPELMRVARAGDVVEYSSWTYARLWNLYLPATAPFQQVCREAKDPAPVVKVFRHGRLVAALPFPR